MIDTIISNPLAPVVYIIIVLSGFAIGGFIADRMRPLFAVVIPVGFLVLSFYFNDVARAHDKIFMLGLVIMIGVFISAGSKKNKYKTGEWPKLKPQPIVPVVTAPPPSPPQPAQTVIHYTDNRDQSIRIDNSVCVTVGAMTPEVARALFGLPTHFTSQRLENAYEEKIRVLDMQAQALPRNNQQARLLISKQEDQLEQAYELLKDN